jgi:hypothetical protein
MPTNKPIKGSDTMKGSDKGTPHKADQVGKSTGKTDTTGGKKGRA